jgi:molecular chaperone DnaK (HSP70)
MNHLLTITDVIARTGERTTQFTIPGHALVDNGQLNEAAVNEAERSHRFLVLTIPKTFGQYVTIVPNLPVDQYRRGQQAREYVGALAQASREVLAANNFVVVLIQTPLKLDLFVTVNTDHAELIKEIDARERVVGVGGVRAQQAEYKAFQIGVNVVVVGENEKTAKSERKLDLQLLPLRSMPIYSGYAAIDFGNTSSALVLSDTNQRDQFDLVAADVRTRTGVVGRPVQTALRISAIKAPAKPGGFFHYKTMIGSQSLEESDAGWLVLGAKRLLSDRKKDAAGGSDLVVLGNQIHHVPAEDPAEVFIMQMLQGMFFHRQSKPRSVAITCPTTFTGSEVARLKRTVARSFLRAEGRGASNFREGMADDCVPLVIDEASAAAFYFAYRDFIDGPGRMPAFRYLYPNGLHMLLYDCGGGTTDLALVRLEARGGGHVEISVLGRAGHRQFGGDFITLQVFRLLKAKFAAAKRRIPELPKGVGQLGAFLTEHQAAIDAAVPTMFDLAQQQNDAAKVRRQTTLFLWRLAESMKKRLSAKGVRDVTPDHSDDETSELALLTQVADRVGLPEGFETMDIVERLKVTRQEVDALVDPEIDRTIEYCNDLIHDGMQRMAERWAVAGAQAPLEIPEIDRVYVVGNASRYPRIKERLLDPERGLRVRYLEERLAEIRSEDFKNSVAKGAVVALRLRDMSAGGQISWDDEFMHKLPFDLVSETLAHAGDNILFRRGDRYSRSMRAWREIPPDARSGKPTIQRIRLDRRWPGETKAEPCMIFQFDEPIAGRFAIRYDEERQTFVMHPDRKGGEDEMLVVAEPFDQAAYLAPPQSGRI